VCRVPYLLVFFKGLSRFLIGLGSDLTHSIFLTVSIYCIAKQLKARDTCLKKIVQNSRLARLYKLLRDETTHGIIHIK
jgi:hypothetical protein